MRYLKIRSPRVGENGHVQLRDELDKFVRCNFDTLYEGGCRLGVNVPEDHWAPRRVQMNLTRLHQKDGLKIADGHHVRNDDRPITADQLRSTVKDLNTLLKEAGKDVPAPFKILIEEGAK